MATVLARGTGRRKSAVARVRMVAGTGVFSINENRGLEDYFPNQATRQMILMPLKEVDRDGAYDFFVHMDGGGVTGQAGALRHGIARALIDLDPELRPALKKAGFLSRDARIKERRKYGLKKARKAPQYTKR